MITEYNLCISFDILHNGVHISINYLISKNPAVKNFYIDCKSKIDLMKADRLHNEYWKFSYDTCFTYYSQL